MSKLQKIYYYDNNPKCTLWDGMWSTRTIKDELEACDIETAPREMFLSYIPKKGRIIDGGCGFGKWVIYLSRKGYDVIGVDNNEIAISKLKNFNKSLKVEFGDILNLEYPDNYYDAYISMGVVEHFEEGPLLALKEANRVLKPNGIIFLSTPTVNVIRKIFIKPILQLLNRLYFLIGKIRIIGNKTKFKKDDFKGSGSKKKRIYRHFVEYRYSIKELHSFLKQSNFKVIQTVPHDFHDSKNHAIGLGVDFPFLKVPYSINFKLNFIGRVISRILDGISPWIACASVLCVGKSLKKQ
ncbi:MAG: class I SAM-dependent methyltransferase [Promethearchaeota archaeon]